MKNMINKNKPILIVLSGALIVMLLIIVPFILFGEKNEKPKDKNFPNYTKIKIDKDTFTNEEKKTNLEDTLSNDTMFQKIMLVSDYDSNKVSRKDLENMITNYTEIYEKSNKKYLPKTDYNYGCMTKNNFVDSYKELYNTDVTEYLEDMSYYYKYIFRKKNYCFYYKAVNPMNIYLKFNNINSTDDIIEANIDIYKYNVSFEDKAYSMAESKFKKYYYNKNYYNAKITLLDELYGEYFNKTIKFKINNNGKFFKYQIISIKTIDN